MSKKFVLPISVLIPTMNRPETLKRTIESYLKGRGYPSQIIVVDQSNNKKYMTENKLILEKCPSAINVVYLYQEKPSLTVARNKALEYAKEEIIICSDDDIEIYEETLNNIFFIMKKKSIAMIAGIDDNTALSKTNIGYVLGTKSYINRKIGHVTLSMLGRYPDNIQGEVETQWAMGYFFVIRKSLIKKWDIHWDEKLLEYAYAEDLDFSYRYYKKAKAQNYKCILHDNVRVKHLVSKEYRIPSCKSTYMFVLHRAYLAHKYGKGIRGQLACQWCNFWKLIQRIFHKENPRDLKEAIKYLIFNRKKIYAGEFYYGDEQPEIKKNYVD